METHFAIVHKDEDSVYGVSFPDLPGCFAAADQIEDLIPNAREALELWFEDGQGASQDKRTAITIVVIEGGHHFLPLGQLARKPSI